jgi:hypothetical protein
MSRKRKTGQRALFVEPLEGRALLSSIEVFPPFQFPTPINGTLFEDLNRNGQRDAGEGPVGGVTVFVDANRNEALDDGEESAVSDSEGHFQLQQAWTSGHQLRLASPAWSEIKPGELYLPRAPDNSVVVGVYRSTSVSGIVFDDVDRDGVRDEGEAGVGGVLVYGAFNYCGRCLTPVAPEWRQVSGRTAVNGSFELHDLPITDTSLGIDYGFVRSTPYTVSGEYQELGALRIPSGGFGVGIVKGRVFDDVNDNGIMDPGERPFVNVRVSAQTAASQGGIHLGPDPGAGDSTDSDGGFTLLGLPAGTFRMDVVQQGPNLLYGLVPNAQTTNASYFPGVFPDPGVLLDMQTIIFTMGALDVGAIDIPAHPYNIISGKMVQRLDELNTQPLVHTLVYLDRNNNKKVDGGEPRMFSNDYGEFAFDHVSPGRYTVRLSHAPYLRLISAPATGTATSDLLVRYQAITFDAPRWSTKGIVFVDRNRNGRQDKAERRIENVLWVLDEDGNGRRNVDEFAGFTNRDGSFEVEAPFGKSTLILHVPPQIKKKLGLFSRKIILEIDGARTFKIGLRAG